jgi:hypothetical protein
MFRIFLISIFFVFSFCSAGLAADLDPIKVQKNLKPIKNKLTIPAKTENTQTTPQGTVTISIIIVDIRTNGYTIEIHNDSSNASGPLIVYVFKGMDDKPFSSIGGSLGVQNLDPGASTQVTIDQSPGWHTGYELFTVQVTQMVNGHEAIVGQKSVSMPPL